jgi:hypothetical protein
VSASGFTSGAVKKAAKYGIILYDLLSLSDEQIESWSKSIRVSVFFYRYDEFEIFLYFDSNDIDEIKPNEIINELKDYYGLRSIYNAPHEFIDSQNLIAQENCNKTVNFMVQFRINDLFLQGKEVKEIEVKGKAGLERIDLNVPMTIAYGDPNVTIRERNVYIQKFNLGRTDIVHHDGKISICLDLSKLEVPPFWQFRFFGVSGQEEYYHEKLEIIEPENINMRIDKCKVSIGAKKL